MSNLYETRGRRIILCLLVLFVLLYIGVGQVAASDEPMAVEGVIDLRGYDFST